MSHSGSQQNVNNFYWHEHYSTKWACFCVIPIIMKKICVWVTCVRCKLDRLCNKLGRFYRKFDEEGKWRCFVIFDTHIGIDTIDRGLLQFFLGIWKCYRLHNNFYWSKLHKLSLIASLELDVFDQNYLTSIETPNCGENWSCVTLLAFPFQLRHFFDVAIVAWKNVISWNFHFFINFIGFSSKLDEVIRMSSISSAFHRKFVFFMKSTESLSYNVTDIRFVFTFYRSSSIALFGYHSAWLRLYHLYFAWLQNSVYVYSPTCLHTR